MSAKEDTAVSTVAGVEEYPVLIEVTREPGLRDVAIKPEEIAMKSAEAIESAMATIQHMSRRLVATVGDMPRRPTQVDIEFGMKLQAEAGLAVIAKAAVEATMTVKLSWTIRESDDEPQH
jgi:hypothetical protein